MIYVASMSAILRTMRALKEIDVIRIMREEWDKKVSALSETIDIKMNSKIDKKTGVQTVVTPELKVRHKKSQIRYTVSSVGPRDVILRTPEGENFLVDAETLEDEYALD